MEGKYKCRSKNCLQPYAKMPNNFKFENSSLTSIVFARDPMSRLVSAWKDKIDRIYGHAYYYKHFTRRILSLLHPNVLIPARDLRTTAKRGFKLVDSSIPILRNSKGSSRFRIQSEFQRIRHVDKSRISCS